MENIDIVFLNFLRRTALLGIIHQNKSYILGNDFIAKIFYYRINSFVYMSKSYFQENEEDIYTADKWRGIKVRPVEQEEDILYNLLKGKIQKPRNVDVGCWITNMSDSLCRKCCGKGYMDWVEGTLEPCKTLYDTSILNHVMKKSYSDHCIYPHQITLLYRNRNMENDYMKDCVLCDVCGGIGYTDTVLSSILPPSSINDIHNLPVILGELHGEYSVFMHSDLTPPDINRWSLA